MAMFFVGFMICLWIYFYVVINTNETTSTRPRYYIPNRHYVYTHSINGRVFYVGKGFKDRAWSTLSRNYYWWRWVNYYHPDHRYSNGIPIQEGIPIPRNNDKVVVNIIKDNMHYSDAYEYEKQIIEQYGVDNLTNILKGHNSNLQEYSKQPIPSRNLKS